MSTTLAPIGPTTNAHFEAIGRVAYEWSRLELFAQQVVGGLAGIPIDTSMIVTNSGNIKNWMETIRRLVALKVPDEGLRQKCKTITEHIENELLRNRNTVIHGLWNVAWDDTFGTKIAPPVDLKSKVTGLKKSGKQMVVEQEFNAAEVRAIADSVKASLEDLQWLTVQLLDASRGKPP